MQTDLILIGGFLGAGKTTFLKEISKFLAAYGKKVGLITNDQASALVDTAFLREENSNVIEVSGSCFCCNYNGFVEAITSLRQAAMDTVIAEPVGSCTDLSATIMQPLKEKNDFRIYPLSVLADPYRLDEILNGADTGQKNYLKTHPSALYIMVKQLEEADLIVINKSDLFSGIFMRQLIEKMQSRFPGKPVISLSAKTGDGFEDWLNAVSTPRAAGANIADVDYDIYAEGEAVLGWLNMAVKFERAAADWNGFAKKFLNTLAEEFDEAGFAVAHVKIMLESGGQSILGNITGNKNSVQLRNTAGSGDSADLILNARVETSPETLLEMVENVLQEQCVNGDVYYNIITANCLSPGRPNPTFRYSEVVA